MHGQVLKTRLLLARLYTV